MKYDGGSGGSPSNRKAPRQSYEKLDGLMRTIERLLRQLSEEKKLAHAEVECWRWDLPTVSLRWTASDFIGRNINACVKDDRAGKLTVEANAWQDVDPDEGGPRVRYWRHEETESALDATNDSLVHQALWTAYVRAAAWTRSDLDRTQEFPTSPS